MKIKVERAALLKALAHVGGVVERRATIPILSNVLLAAEDGQLALTATDMEIAIVERLPCTVTRAGRTTVAAAGLLEIIRKLPDGAEIQLEHPGGDAPLALRAGRYTGSLVCLPAEDFPAIAEGQLPVRFALPAGTLRALIDRTRFAISTEETRYYLNGIYLHAAEVAGQKVLRAVATDGHRLARVEEPLPEGASAMPGVIVPRKTVAEIRKLVEETPDEVQIALSDTRIKFTTGAAELTSKLIDGTFPDYERVIPRDNDKTLLVACKRFSDAVDRVAAISSERARAVKLSIAPRLLVLTSASPEQGSATEELEDGELSYESNPIEIGFQARYLRDITEQIKGDRVEFRFSDGAAPTVVRDAGDASALYVLMPMRV